MGEAKRRRMIGQVVDAVTGDMADRGRLIEVGWIALRKMAMAPDATETQVTEMRMAFFAGAQHLFHSIMGVLDPGAEPTDRDLVRMDLIDSELRAFIQEFKAKHNIGDDVLAPETGTRN